MVEPKCPGCEIVGIDKIVSRESEEANKRGDPWFYIVYCNNCGHIYGVFAKHVISTNMTSSIGVPNVS